MTPYYEQDGITIYHGDCRDILPELESDFIFTSPPYVDARTYESGLGFPYEKDAWISWLTEILKLCLCKSDTVMNVGDRVRDNVRQWDASDFASFARQSGVNLWERFVWLKDNAGPNGSNSRPDDIIEFCLWFGNGSSFKPNNVRRKYSPATLARYKTAPSKRLNANGDRSDRVMLSANELGARPATVISTVALPTHESLGHPAQFPISLASWFIQAGTELGELVMDPFMGSGTTLRSAKDLGRKAIGIEIEERYCEIAANRLAQQVLAL